MTGSFFNVVNRGSEITFACQVFRHLPVSQTFHGKAVRGNSGFHQGPDFFFQPFFQHPVNPLINSFIEKIPVHGKAKHSSIIFQLILFCLRDPVSGQCRFQCAHHPAHIIGMQPRRCGRIFFFQPGIQFISSLFGSKNFQLPAQFRVFFHTAELIIFQQSFDI